MHELSIVHGIVTAVSEGLASHKVARVYAVRLKVGALSGVVEDALQFSYGIATEGTVLEGSRLEVIPVPVALYCDLCDKESELPGVHSFCCPLCGAPSMNIRRGRELEIESLEIEEEDATKAEGT